MQVANRSDKARICQYKARRATAFYVAKVPLERMLGGAAYDEAGRLRLLQELAWTIQTCFLAVRTVWFTRRMPLRVRGDRPKGRWSKAVSLTMCSPTAVAFCAGRFAGA